MTGENELTEEQKNLTLMDFKQYLEEDGKSARTVQSYTNDIDKFFRNLNGSGNKKLAEINRADATSFITELRRQRFKPATVNKAVNSLACFCRFLKDKGILQESAAVVVPRKDRIKIAAGSEKEVSVLTEIQINALLTLASDRCKTSQRNQLVVHLLLYAGIRVSELVGIRIADLDLFTNALTVRGKGGKLREVPLRAGTVELAKECSGRKLDGVRKAPSSSSQKGSDPGCVNSLIS